MICSCWRAGRSWTWLIAWLTRVKCPIAQSFQEPLAVGVVAEDRLPVAEGRAPLLSSGVAITLSVYDFIPNGVKTKSGFGSPCIYAAFGQETDPA